MAGTTLASGPGFDWLTGGLGADTYSLAGSFGLDVIDVGAGIAETGFDVVEISGHFAEDLVVYRSSDHYAAVDITTGDLAAVLDFYAGTADSIDQMEMPSSAGGTVAVRPTDDLDANGVLDIHEVFLPSYGTDGADTLTAATGTYQEIVYGGLGNDTLTGSSEFSVLFGGGGNETLRSGGGSEDTNMVGGGGGDTYWVFSGHGGIVSDQSASPGDRLELPGVTLAPPPSTFRAITIDSRHLFLGDAANGSGVVVMDWQTSQGEIETYAFSNVTLTHDSLVSALSTLDNFTWEELGLSTAGVNRELDVLAFMAGSDDGPDFAAFAGGTSANETIKGFSGDNIAYGGAGDDTLVGGLGDDRYLFRAGAGDDRVDNVSGAAPGETNTLVFGPGIAPADLSIGASGVDIVVGYTAVDSVRLAGWNGGQSGLARQVEVSFVDDGTYTLLVATPGTAGDDLLFGTVLADTLTAGAGNDIVYADAGDDLIVGGSRAGTDSYDGDAGDVLDGLGGDDTLTGGGGNDWLHGEGGAAPPQQAFTDTGLFPEVAKLVDIGDLPEPGDGALGIAGHDTAPGDAAIATLTFVGGVAGYANSVGMYTVPADGTIGDVDLAFADVKALDVGETATVTLPGGADTGFGLFLVIHGARLNGGYDGLDLEGGTLSFVYDLDGADERAARITDAGTDITLVHDDGPTRTVLEGPVVHATDRGGAALLNADDTVHVVAGRLTAEDDTTLRIGFEDMPGGGDADFNDVVVNLEVHSGSTEAADTLAGGPGDDTLTGGVGEDLFQFGAGGGTDRVTDFRVGSDLFDLQDTLTIGTLATVDADGDSFFDDTLVTLSDGAVELIGVTGVTESDLLGP